MITVVIITYNEEEKITACLKSVLPACDECIVIDAESTDDTVKIAKELGAKVYSKKWKGYGAARNYGASIAQNPWILSIDADERVDSELLKNVSHVPRQDNTIYRFNRLTKYCGQWIKHGTWHPEWKDKLYNRDYFEWDNKPVHEELIPLKGQRKKSKIKGILLHDAYATQEDLERKLAHYAHLSMQEMKVNQSQPSHLKKVFSPKYHFIKSYFWKRGFLDGKAGFKIAKAIESYHRKKLNY